MIPSAQLDPTLQVGSDKQASADNSPIIECLVNGATSQYAIEIDGVTLPGPNPDGLWRGDPWAKIKVQCPTLPDGQHVMTWREVWPEPRECIPFTFRIDTVPPPAPTVNAVGPNPPASFVGTTPNAQGKYLVTARGTASPGANVRAYLTPGGFGGAIANSAGAWTVNFGYRSPGSYVMTATVVDGAGNISPTSNAVPVTAGSVTPPQPQPPAKVTGLTARTNSVALAWNAVSGATSYVVRRNGVVNATVTTTSYLDSDPVNLPDSYYTVAAVNAVGEGPQSDPSTVTV